MGTASFNVTSLMYTENVPREGEAASESAFTNSKLCKRMLASQRTCCGAHSQSLLREEQGSDVRLGLLHDQAQSRVEGVVNGDFAAHAVKHHAAHAVRRKVGLVDLQGDCQSLASLAFDDFAVLVLRAVHAVKHHA